MCDVVAQLTTASKNFSSRIMIGLPRGFDDRAALDLRDEINALLEERFGVGTELSRPVPSAGAPIAPAVSVNSVEALVRAVSERPAAAACFASSEAVSADPVQEDRPQRPFMSSEAFASYAKEESLKLWPQDGTVSLEQIVNYWTIGKSSFRVRVSSGEFIPALEMKGRSKASPKLWNASIIGRQLADAGFFRRGIVND